jgi:predicted protein tyrosine phosphatase
MKLDLLKNIKYNTYILIDLIIMATVDTQPQPLIPNSNSNTVTLGPAVVSPQVISPQVIITNNSFRKPKPNILIVMNSKELPTEDQLFISDQDSTIDIESNPVATPGLTDSQIQFPPSTSKYDIDTNDLFLREMNDLIIGCHRGEDRTDPLTKITEEIYLGQGRTTLYGGMLKKLGITHILSIGKTPHNSVREGKFHQFEIQNVEDSSTANLEVYFPITITYIQKVIENKGKVYVHCEMGCSRSAAIVIATIRAFGWTDSLQESYDYIKAVRHWINPNPSFMEQLRHFFGETLIGQPGKCVPAPRSSVYATIEIMNLKNKDSTDQAQENKTQNKNYTPSRTSTGLLE